MTKRLDVLDQISVASPCSADWDEMEGNDQVRFCRHCSLHVHDLSKTTRKDATRLVAASEGRLCVRYRKRPDGTLHTAERAEPLTHIKRRLSRIAAGAFTASLSLAANVAAQSPRPAGGDRPVAIQPAYTVTLGRIHVRNGQSAALYGTVSDEAKMPVPGSMVVLISAATGREQSVLTDDEGVYQFYNVDAGAYLLRVSRVGFETFELREVVLRGGEQERVDVTLEAGASLMGDVSVVLPSTPLGRAVWAQDMAEVRRLLAQGVEVNVVDEGLYVTALGAAVESGRLEFVQVLLQAGADPNVRNRFGGTSLMSLDQDATPELVRLLVANGAQIGLTDHGGNSALHTAVAVAKPEVLRALLDAGAEVNAKNGTGFTALMYAAQNGRVDNAKALLDAGADPHWKNEGGMSALNLAESSGHQKVVALLRAYGVYE